MHKEQSGICAWAQQKSTTLSLFTASGPDLAQWQKSLEWNQFLSLTKILNITNQDSSDEHQAGKCLDLLLDLLSLDLLLASAWTCCFWGQ